MHINIFEIFINVSSFKSKTPTLNRLESKIPSPKSFVSKDRPPGEGLNQEAGGRRQEVGGSNDGYPNGYPTDLDGSHPANSLQIIRVAGSEEKFSRDP
jgi:hypothetical protein